MEWFGLGILLNAKDNASSSLSRVSSSLIDLTENLRNTGDTATSESQRINQAILGLQSQMWTGLGMQKAGQGMMSFSGAVMSSLIGVEKQTIATGSQFEQWRMTLKALYKDADLANEKLKWGMDLAATTPFELPDVTQALIGFKAMGVEADQIMTSTEGIQQSMLEFVGDLAALRPDIGLDSVMMGVRNLMGGDGGKSLRMRLDLPLEEILGREFGDTQEQLMQDVADLSSKVANGLMGELEGTWEQMLSNMNDQTTRFFLSIADNGAFDKAKSTLGYMSEAIGGISDDKLKAIGTNIAKSFDLIWRPIDLVVRKGTDLFIMFTDLVAQSPFISQLTVTVIGLVGGLTALMGAMLIIGGTFLIVKSGIGLFFQAISSLKLGLLTLKSRFIALLPVLSKYALIGGLMYGAWKTDFGGMRTILTTFMSNIQKAFSYSAEIVGMSAVDMAQALKELDTSTFSGWLTYKLVELRMLWIGLCDAWSDYTLSDENFQKLRDLGLLPLLETILDLKMRAEAFFEGFKEGISTVSDVVSKALQAIGDIIVWLADTLFPDAKYRVDELNDSGKALDFKPWQDFGEMVAYALTALAGVKIIGLIASAITGVGGLVLKLWGGLTSVWGLITTVIAGIGAVVTFVLGLFGVVVTWPALLVGAITVAIGALVYFIVDNWERIKQFFADTLDAIGVFFVNLWEGIKQACSDVCGWVKQLWSGVKQFFSDLWSAIKDVAGQALDGILNIASNISDGVKSAWSGVTDFFGGIFDGIKSTASKFFDWIGEKFGWVANLIGNAKDALGSIGDGIKNGASKVWNGAKNLVGLNTGGYVRNEGVAMLHPNEVVVNDTLTQQLRTFLDSQQATNGEPITQEPRTRSMGSQEDASSRRRSTLNAITNVNNSTDNSVDKSSTATNEDNSIVFESGAIQITSKGNINEDVEQLFKEFAKRIQRESKLRKTLNYKPV